MASHKNTTNQRKASFIQVSGAKQNNLKNIDVKFPSRKLTVITGVSGSGKSSLAFDTLYAEGQRRYIESLSTYTRQFLQKMPKPDCDKIENIPASIALEQRNTVMGSRSTVGTQTELIDYLRILFAKIGKTQCIDCGSKVDKINPQFILEQACKWFIGKKAAIAAPITPHSESKKNKKLKTLTPMLQFFREQGFQRILWQKTKKNTKMIDLSDLESSDFPKIPVNDYQKQKLYLIADRLKIIKTPDEETKIRLLDSIEQAIAIGKGQLIFFDLDTQEKASFHCHFACTKCGKSHQIPEPQFFSFNSPLGACSNCTGFGYNLDLDESLVVPDPTKTLKNGAIDPLSKPSLDWWQSQMFRFLERNNISIGKRYSELNQSQKKLIWEGSPKDSTFPGVTQLFEELARKKYKIHVRVFIRRYQSQTLCKVCNGSRLKPESLAVKINKKSIAEILEMSISKSHNWFNQLKLSKNDQKIAKDALFQVSRRLKFLNDVGVGYLCINRMTKTLSGGEFQRINLATQLGNGLCGTLYVLDEPSIGLHAADTQKMIKILQDLKDQGNTVVIVEHDLDIMKIADHLIEIGPGAGIHGGEIIAQGKQNTLIKTKGSITGKYLADIFEIERDRPVRKNTKKFLKITGCNENNLKNITAQFPLERFTVVTGISGSGKSTLVHKTLYHSINQIFNPESKSKNKVGAFQSLYGAENISGIILLDQKPIGKSSRSNPATYLKAWDEVRRIYANQVISMKRGYTPQYFSFNVDGGRCPECKGEGEITIDMHFMAEMKIPCEECNGNRFKKNLLDVYYRNKNITDLLNSTIDEAYDIFRDSLILNRKFSILREVGLGYLKVGQSATTLSGGESQRLKIASALNQNYASKNIYIFDEPTTGLHLEDIKKLMSVLQDLVDEKNTIIMVEHHLDVIAQADWIIDLGPSGGENGGKIIAQGNPGDIAKTPDSITGQILNKSGYKFPRRYE